MAAYIQTLYDSAKTDIIYPQTLAQAVFTSGNQNVEVVLNTKLTTPQGTQGQFLGYVSDNVIGAVDKPTSSSTFNTSYEGTINSSGWISSNGKYYKQFNLSSMTSDQTPLVFPQWTTNVDNEQSAWGELTSIQSYNGYVRFYANSPINTTVNFILLYTTYDNNLVALSTNGSNVIGTFTPM